MARLVYVGAWFAATGLVTILAFQALGAAEAGTRDRPLTPVVVDSPLQTDTTVAESATTDPSDTTATSPASSSSSSSSTLSDDGAASGGGSDGSVGDDHSTTTEPDDVSTPTTEPEETTTSSTAVSAVWESKDVATGGGTVTIGYRPEEVRLDGAIPASGFEVSVEKMGPDELRVTFEGADVEYEVRAYYSGGELVIEVE